MKILLSAYACEPDKGSEPGVGWHWALEIEKLGHQVWVLTRENNRVVIEEHWKNNSKPQNLNFIYYDAPRWLTWWKKGGRGVYLYYFFWQFGAFFKARSAHKIVNFSKVQHITFVTVRQPSFLGLLGIPFVFGPVGGGERAPRKLRQGFGLKGRLKDSVRDAVNQLVKVDPFMLLTFSTADEIFVTSEQTKKMLPWFIRKKAKVQLAIGFAGNVAKDPKLSDTIALLYVGRFEYWKGMALGIRAFSEMLKKQPDVTLTMVGKGPDKDQWVKLAEELAVADKITWVEWVEQSELGKLYQTHDLFLFPSLHDSGGMVLLEAMSYGLPVVCLDLGGPGLIVDDSCGRKVNVDGRNEEQVVVDLSRAIFSCLSKADWRHKLAQGALTKANAMSWSKVVGSVYRDAGKS